MVKQASRIEKRVDNSAEARADVRADAQRILREYLGKAGLKNSAKRDFVLSVFLDTRDHLSTEELHNLVKAKDPSIGYTTVYRTLKLLAKCDLASEVEFHDGVMRYEHSLYRRTHHHMVCTSCGDSIEFFAPEIEAVEARIGRKFHFTPARHNFQIYGICKTCHTQQKQH